MLRTRLGYNAPHVLIGGVLRYEIGIVTSAIAIASGLASLTITATFPAIALTAALPGVGLSASLPAVTITGEVG